ncbi:MAG: ABC transporter permease [Dongiaceae bacterium]
MLIYVAQRLGLAVLICICAITVLFSFIYVIPGDPATIALGPRASAETKQRFQEEMALDKPMHVRLARFIGRVVKGDLGNDLFSRRPVTTIVLEALPNTLILIAAALGWAVLLGIPLGCFSAIRRNSFIDKFTGVISVATISIPSFVVAVYVVLIFAVKLDWLPYIGLGERGDFWDQFKHLLMPAFAVGLGWVGYLARLVRASMLEVLGENHIRTARAFGLSERLIVSRYALRIGILPTVTLLGLAIGGLLSSAVFAESVFARPGIGKLVVDMVASRNYPVVEGAVLVTVGLFVLATLISDLVVAWLDPRVRANL